MICIYIRLSLDPFVDYLRINIMLIFHGKLENYQRMSLHQLVTDTFLGRGLTLWSFSTEDKNQLVGPLGIPLNHTATSHIFV